MSDKQTTTFSVPEVSCGHCVSAITKEVSSVPGVQKVDVSLSSKQVTVTADTAVTREQLVAAINEAGYEVAR
jgi:copper ion binding protein